MPELRMVDVALLVPPDKPMRTESLYANWAEFCESLAHGQHQNIVVKENADGTLRIIAGMRRSLAAREIGLKQLSANVYAQDEAVDEFWLMGQENLHRSDLDPVEEAEYYRDAMEQWRVGPGEVARRCRRSASHVSAALNLLEGDPDVLRALRDNKINKAQAQEINRFTDPIGRKNALHYARENGLSSRFLKQWREEREAAGTPASSQDVADAIGAIPDIQMESRMKCIAHGTFVPLGQIQLRAICEDCYGLMMAMLEEWHRQNRAGGSHAPQ